VVGIEGGFDSSHRLLQDLTGLLYILQSLAAIASERDTDLWTFLE